MRKGRAPHGHDGWVGSRGGVACPAPSLLPHRPPQPPPAPRGGQGWVDLGYSSPDPISSIRTITPLPPISSLPPLPPPLPPWVPGSMNMSYDSSNLTTPDIKWLGVRPSDLDRFNIPQQCRLPMTEEDIKTGKKLVRRHCWGRGGSAAGPGAPGVVGGRWLSRGNTSGWEGPCAPSLGVWGDAPALVRKAGEFRGPTCCPYPAAYQCPPPLPSRHTRTRVL